MPLVLTLDEVNPNPDNPRTSRNPKYEEIKSSIRARGLDTVPKVTRDPERPELGYFFSDGGNTRYAILSGALAGDGGRTILPLLLCVQALARAIILRDRSPLPRMRFAVT